MLALWNKLVAEKKNWIVHDIYSDGNICGSFVYLLRYIFGKCVVVAWDTRNKINPKCRFGSQVHSINVLTFSLLHFIRCSSFFRYLDLVRASSVCLSACGNVEMISATTAFAVVVVAVDSSAFCWSRIQKVPKLATAQITVDEGISLWPSVYGNTFSFSFLRSHSNRFLFLSLCVSLCCSSLTGNLEKTCKNMLR